MTKHELMQVRSLRDEQAELKRQRDDLLEELLDVTPPDHVRGSYPDFPYTMHTVTIPGETHFRTDPDAAPLWDALDALDRKITRYGLQIVRAYGQVLDWIMTIDDSRTRRIFELRYLAGKSWQQIANAFQNEITQEGIRKIHNRFLKNI